MEQEAPEPEVGPPGTTDGEGEARTEGEAHLVFVTHPAYERDMQACLHELRQLTAVRRIGGLVRVVGP